MAAVDFKMHRSRTRTEQAFSHVVAEAAAARAVDDILIALVQEGSDPEVAKAIAYAAQEIIVGAEGYLDRARSILHRAGFRNGELQLILDELETLTLEHV